MVTVLSHHVIRGVNGCGLSYCPPCPFLHITKSFSPDTAPILATWLTASPCAIVKIRGEKATEVSRRGRVDSLRGTSSFQNSQNIVTAHPHHSHYPSSWGAGPATRISRTFSEHISFWELLPRPCSRTLIASRQQL